MFQFEGDTTYEITWIILWFVIIGILTLFSNPIKDESKWSTWIKWSLSLSAGMLSRYFFFLFLLVGTYNWVRGKPMEDSRWLHGAAFLSLVALFVPFI
jgi:hypothetical protein